jgi:hypothetical protein
MRKISCLLITFLLSIRSLFVQVKVVTAAHCLAPFQGKKFASPPFGAGVGQRSLVEIFDNGRIPAVEGHIPAEYDPQSSTSTHDVGLIKLAKSVTNVTPACLAKSNPKDGYGNGLKAIGWGSTTRMVLNTQTGEWSGFTPPKRLKEADMKDVTSSAASCRNRPDLICIGPVTDGDASCKGDSGGSLVNGDDLVVGFTSFGGSKRISSTEYQTCNGDTAYTRASGAIAWIEKVINGTICTK